MFNETFFEDYCEFLMKGCEGRECSNAGCAKCPQKVEKYEDFWQDPEQISLFVLSLIEQNQSENEMESIFTYMKLLPCFRLPLTYKNFNYVLNSESETRISLLQELNANFDWELSLALDNFIRVKYSHDFVSQNFFEGILDLILLVPNLEQVYLVKSLDFSD